jgi:acyl-CoA synthetase (AMP-forming)/AMP-acid ligase II
MTNTLLTLLSAERLTEHYRAGHWHDETIYMRALMHVQAHPERYAVRDAERRLTYRELIEAADRLAAQLRARGVRRGQRIAVWLPSRVETAVAVLACSRDGFVCCPSLHRDHTVGEVIKLLQRMRAAALITQAGYGADGDRHDVFRACEQDLPWCACIPLKGLEVDAPSVVSTGDACASTERTHSTDPNHVMYLAFTSGTTGEPKGVMHSDNTLLSNVRGLAQDWEIHCESVIYTLSPLSHNLGLGALVTALAVGGELVVHDLPRGRGLLARLQEVGATFLFGVPTHAIDLLAEVRARGEAQLRKVRGFRISGAAISPEVVCELMRCGVMPQSGYGMTETCSHQYTLPTDDLQLIAETCGRSCPGYEVRIFQQDNPDIEAAVGEVGQIGGRGASLMLGYFDDQAATEAAFNADGWFMTGDLGWADENGYLRITGRKKDIILRGGRNIHPAQIESLATKHPEIERAAAVPVKDSRLGERVCLAVVVRDGAAIEPAALLQHLHEAGLSKYDMPEYLLFLDDMPVTASGKTLKRELVRWIEEGRLKPSPIRFQPPI